jgi:hypothetical protein
MVTRKELDGCEQLMAIPTGKKGLLRTQNPLVGSVRIEIARN